MSEKPSFKDCAACGMAELAAKATGEKNAAMEHCRELRRLAAWGREVARQYREDGEVSEAALLTIEGAWDTLLA